MYRSRAVVIVAILAGFTAWLQVSPAPGGTERQSGVQVTPDCKRTLISKDVGGQRWAITRNADDSTVTGNVYQPEGGDPLFVYCTQASATADEVTLSCFGADKCEASPCGGDQFQFIAEVPLTLSFFLPPGVSDQVPACAPPEGAAGVLATEAAAGAAGSNGGSESAAGVRQSGLQVTPDGKRTLINKDVSGQRWTITRNADDGTVTGNVYQPEGGDPLFLFCTQVAATTDQVTLSCSGADKCTAAPCGRAQFNFIAQVDLPQSFFAPPAAGGTCGNNVADPGEDCDGADLVGATCATEVGRLGQCSGAVACGADCRYVLSGCNCPCQGDLDCDALIDCSAIVPECEVEGACEGGRCFTSPTGTPQLCNGSDPDDPEFLRCEE